MHIVRVEIDKKIDKPRWHEVPESLAYKINKGDTLLCFHKNYEVTGKATTNVMHGDGIEELLGQSKSHFDDLKVLAKFEEFIMEDIKIPDIFSSTYPSIEKINKRLEEYYDSGKFNTLVKLNHDNLMLDGYTAYLVARMFGEKTLLGIKVEG